MTLNLFFLKIYRIQPSTMEWKMFRFVRGRQLMNEVDRHRLGQAQQTMQYHRAYYGCLIMLYTVVQVAKRNFGWAGENIIAGWCFFLNAN